MGMANTMLFSILMLATRGGLFLAYIVAIAYALARPHTLIATMHRLLLFDIDGTLVSGGPAKDAFHVALLEAFGTAGDIDGHDFSGKTDPQIARELE